MPQGTAGEAEGKAPEKQEFIISEVEKLLGAGVIREVIHADWLANPVVVLKHIGGKR